MSAATVTTETDLNTELCKFLPLLSSSINDSVRSLVGLAIELSHDSKVPVLALWTRNHGVIIQLRRFESNIPTSLYNFLSLSELTFVGPTIKDSAARLKQDYGLDCRNIVDLGELAASVLQKSYLKSCGLLHLCHVIFGLQYPIESTVITTPWNESNLDPGQTKKVAGSAHFSFALGNKLLGGSYLAQEAEMIVSNVVKAMGSSDGCGHDHGPTHVCERDHGSSHVSELDYDY